MTNGAETEKILKILEGRKLFSRLNESSLQLIANASVLQDMKPKQTLWNIGDSGEHCTFILHGLVEILRPSGTEQDCCMGIFGPNDFIGLSAVMRRASYPGSAIAIQNSTIIQMFALPFMSNPDISNFLREMLLRHEQIISEKVTILSAGEIDDRFFELLKYLKRRFATKKSSGCKTEIEVTLSKSKAAKLMGLRSETTIRLINKWQKLNLILWQENKITVHDMDAIERYVVMGHSK